MITNIIAELVKEGQLIGETSDGTLAVGSRPGQKLIVLVYMAYMLSGSMISH